MINQLVDCIWRCGSYIEYCNKMSITFVVVVVVFVFSS